MNILSYIKIDDSVIKKKKRALTGVAQWTEGLQSKGLPVRFPVRAHGLQAKCPVGGTGEATTLRCFSPSLSPSLPLPLKINK